MPIQLELHDLGALVTDALGKMRPGEEITIADHGQPVAKIVSVQQIAPQPTSPQRGRGLFKGQIWMADDFDAPLPEEELLEWEK